MRIQDDSTVHVLVEKSERGAQLTALVGRAGGGAQMHRTLAEFLSLDVQYMRGCLIVDVAIGCAQQLQPLWDAQPSVPVIVITAPGDVDTAVTVMKQGAFDCFESPLIEDEGFVLSLDAAMRRNAESWLHLQRRAELRARMETLTPREREVMSLLAEGTLNKIIASRLGLSRRTVETHRTNVMSKMQAASIAQLINMSLLLDRPARRRAGKAPVWRRSITVPVEDPLVA